MFEADFGTGNLGDVEIANGITKVNSYARVLSINKNVIEVDLENAEIGSFADFKAGENVLVHVAATNGTDAQDLGRYILTKIQLVSGNLLTLEAELFAIDLNYYYIQVIAVPQFRNLTLKDGGITAAAYDVFKHYGGVIVFQVFDTLTITKGYITLEDRGIPAQKGLTYRPLTAQEVRGENDAAELSGAENYQTAGRLILNAGDGAAFILCKKVIADSESRIGNPETHGRAKCRGAADSPFKPSNVTNIGGSTILLAAEEMSLPVEVLAKYRSSGKAKGRGLCRCHVASNTLLPDDEKLYSFDILKDEMKLQGLGIIGWGRGTLGAAENPGYALNNYAKITYCVGNKLYFEGKTLSGASQIKVNNKVIVRSLSSEFVMAEVLEAGEDWIYTSGIVEGAAEIISVAEFSDLTLNKIYQKGIVAVSVAGTLRLGGELGERGEVKGNSQSWNRIEEPGLILIARKIVAGGDLRLKSNVFIVAEEFENFSADMLKGNSYIYTKIA